MGLAEARARAAKIMTEVDQGRDPFSEQKYALVDAKRTVLTLSDLVDDYLEDKRHLASIAEIERELRKDVLPTLGCKQPAKITPGDIDMIASEVLDRGATVMARRLIVHVKAMYNYCLFDAPRLAEKYGLSLNPAERLGRRRRGGTNRFEASRPRERVLDDAEISAWWGALSASLVREDTKMILMLVLVTAQRPGEVRRIARSQLVLESVEPTWTIPGTIAKNGRPHVVPLSELAEQLLRRALSTHARGDLVFPTSDTAEPVKKVVLPMAMATVFRNHLPHMNPATAHDLRRTAATGMRRIGIAPDIVSLILNHMRQDVTGRHYDHYQALRERREGMALWGAHLKSLVEQTIPCRASAMDVKEMRHAPASRSEEP